MKNFNLVLMSAGIVIGVIFASFGFENLWLLGLIILIGITLLLFSVLDVTSKKSSFRVFLIIISIGIGLSWFHIYNFIYKTPENVFSKVNFEIKAEGVICSEPDEREKFVKLSLCDIVHNDLDFASTRILLTTNFYPTLKYGDKVSVVGELKLPKSFKGGDGRDFDYIGYLAKDHIKFVMYYPEIKKIGDDFGNPIKTLLFKLKHKFLENVSSVVPEPHASLMGGLVVGAKRALGEDLLDAFRITGVIHIVVLSGYNITIVADSIIRFFSFLPRTISMYAGGISIVLFAIMTGAGATIVRASIMALLVTIARVLGRSFNVTRALLLAGLIMVFHNPYIVVFDPSFQLSFVAMIGLIYVSPIVEQRLRFLPKKFGLREVASATISTQIFVLPAIIYMMGEISIVAVLVNLLILTFIPITMLLGFLTGVTGFISRTFSIPFAILSFMFLYYELLVVEWFAQLPFASISIGHFPIYFVLLIYALYGFVLYKIYCKGHLHLKDCNQSHLKH